MSGGEPLMSHSNMIRHADSSAQGNHASRNNCPALRTQ